MSFKNLNDMILCILLNGLVLLWAWSLDPICYELIYFIGLCVQTQAQYLEQILREFHAHPKVNGIIIWSAWSPGGCYQMCLTDNNFNNLQTGNVVDKLIKEWGGSTLAGTADTQGFFEASLSHGDYEVKITHPTVKISSLAQRLEVSSLEQTTLHLQVSA